MSDLILETIPSRCSSASRESSYSSAVTFGYHRPRWDLYSSERPARFVLLSDVRTWIGLAFWIGVVVVAHGLFGGESV
jgi:hypothetical protein